MTAQWYVNDILQSHVLPLMQWLPGDIFQQNNAQPHPARVSLNSLRAVTTLPWSARLSDLSPIEHIWDDLGRLVGHPTSLNELEASRIPFEGTKSNSIAENYLQKSWKSSRGLTSAEGLTSTKKRVANVGRREGIGANLRATSSTRKHNASYVCPVCGVNYFDESRTQEWVQSCGSCSSWFLGECVE
ncbi:transposable element Tcb2 transposase [Trichonephila clavipes]|nr:transposable element Tcb2 transposase [Trichonephila clavipes]